MARKIGVVENPEIVEDFMIGNTRIKIAVNFCKDKTKEDVDAILKHIEQIVLNDRRNAALREQAKNKEEMT